MLFNRTPLRVDKLAHANYDGREIKMTPSLWNASFDDALRFGGDLTRYFLQSVELAGDRRHVTVDTKIHMLMPGMLPAIPGWHTDGVPRHPNGAPSGPYGPLLDFQEQLDADGAAPRYHLFVTGDFCSTEFLTEQVDLDLPKTSSLYASMTQQLNAMDQDAPLLKTSAPADTWVHWDWWNIHRAIPAQSDGWRMLIRVTESDFLPPQNDIRNVIRLHNPVYIQQSEFGW